MIYKIMPNKSILVVLFGCILFIVIWISSCSRTEEIVIDESAIRKADSLCTYADSIRVFKLHKNFQGTHSHGTGLAVHAHQNIRKKRRLMKKRAETWEDKKTAFQKARIQRDKEIDKIRKKSVVKEQSVD